MKMRYTASSIPHLRDRTVLFDANSLLYIFWPTTPDSQESIDYGSILASLMKYNVNLVVNETVLSETINTILRIEFNKRNLSPDDFKSFRDSGEGKAIQEDVHEIIRNRILKLFKVVSEPVSQEDLASILLVNRLDFNDKLIELLCRKKDMLLLTHDFDFASSDIDILSANRRFTNHRL